LRQLDVPVAQLVPGELVQRRGHEVEAIGLHGGLDARERPAEARSNPAVRHRCLRIPARIEAGRGALALAGGPEHEAGCVPELVAELAIALDAREIEADLARGGRK